MAGIASRYQKEKKDCPVLRMIVIYTGDIMRGQVSCEYNIGAARLKVEPAFLSELDAEGIFLRLKEKVENGLRLTDEELMEFIILPLSYREKVEKEQKVREVVELAVQVHDKAQQAFTLAGILAFTDKVIDGVTANKIRRAIEMTQVARIFEEEKQQALAQALTQASGNVVVRMIKMNYPAEEIVSIMPDYSKDDVDAIRKEVVDSSV